jgi:NADH-quinone oxidoreductase subunit L
MGGLRKYLPITWATFLIGAVAIAGIPPFAGFFSKDEILWYAYSSELGSPVLWFLGVAGALMTAFYMFRLFILTFEGKERFDHHHVHPHEAPASMTVPLMILAGLSIVGGFLGVPASLGGGNIIEHWLAPVFEPARRTLMLASHGVHAIEYILMAVSVLIAAGGIYVAWRWYLQTTGVPARWQERFPKLYRLLANKYYVDEAYDAAIVRPIQISSDRFLWKFFDVGVIDGAVNGSGRLVEFTAGWLRRIQTGVAQSYAVVFVGGIILVVSALLFL